MSDVCLILEGTYPYVTGGVSSVVHQMIKGTPQINYSILYIGATEHEKGIFKYELPSNVRYVKEVFLYDYNIKGEPVYKDFDFDFSILGKFHSMIKSEDLSSFVEIYDKLFHPMKKKIDPFEFFESKQVWDYVEQAYNEKFSSKVGVSFIDFFYQWRFTHYPIFKILSTELPKANVYHCLSTGYAGLMGINAKIGYNKPLVLTEHGIYSHEREIEIYQSNWIHQKEFDFFPDKKLGYFKNWWISFFHFMGHITYQSADVITTLYSGNKDKQINYGAPGEKIEIVPNGINVDKFKTVERTISDSESLTIGFIGRVVPIKDIKTLLKGFNLVKQEIPTSKLLIMGPSDEDPEYFEECSRLVSLLELEDNVEFTGKVNIMDYLPLLDLCVLSSISEGQPMVLLECFAAGIPAVATDVGACRDLIYGMKNRDEYLGSCGEVVPFGRPDLLGKEMLKILKDDDMRKEMSKVARMRTDIFYREEKMLDNYMSVYNRFLSKSF